MWTVCCLSCSLPSSASWWARTLTALNTGNYLVTRRTKWFIVTAKFLENLLPPPPQGKKRKISNFWNNFPFLHLPYIHTGSWVLYDCHSHFPCQQYNLFLVPIYNLFLVDLVCGCSEGLLKYPDLFKNFMTDLFFQVNVYMSFGSSILLSVSLSVLLSYYLYLSSIVSSIQTYSRTLWQTYSSRLMFICHLVLLKSINMFQPSLLTWKDWSRGDI